MRFKDKNILVLGLGKSGKSSIKFLQENKANITVFDDDKNKLIEFLKENQNLKVLEYQTEFNISKFDYIVVSPGIKPNHNIISLAKMCEVPTITEVELVYEKYKPFLIGVTGSNGKTTTTTLINNILNTKYKTIACGNIGTPVCEIKSQQYDALVVEMSSFQLTYINKLKFNISVILNLSENHLDWHFNFNDYKIAKENIYKNSKKNDYLILNADDKNLQSLNLYKLKCKVLWFSSKKECEGIFVKNNKIYLNISKKEEVCDVSCINLIGEHNLQNSLAAILISKLLGVSNKKIIKTLLEFNGLEHRIENFYEFEGIKCFNDSKSTTLSSTLSAIKALKEYDIVLLLGGSSKNLNYDKLAKNIPQNVKQILVFGETKNDIAKSLNKYNINYIMCENINNAILSSVTSGLTITASNDTKYHFKNHKNKVCILFSPASASFDSFNSYEERGIYFKEYLKSCVEDILKK